MNHPCLHSSRSASTLVVALLTVAVLSLVAANVLLSVSARYNSAFRSGSWNEALVIAQEGVDIVAAEFLHAVPDVRATTDGLGTGFSQPATQFISGLQISPAGVLTSPTLLNGTLASPKILMPTHGGEGNTTAGQAQVSVQVVPLGSLLSNGLSNLPSTITSLASGNNIQLVRLCSTGTVYLTGGTLAGMSRQDNDLWRVSLLTDRLSGAALTTPTVTRQIEAYLRPVYAFEGTVASNDALLATDQGTVFDSFNSTLDSASTNHQYDSVKRQAHATVRANGSNVVIGGKVWGNVDTNGGNVVPGANITGTVNNASYEPLPLVKTPSWSGLSSLTASVAASLGLSGLVTGNLTVPGSVTGSLTLPAGPLLLPTQYKFDAISGNLHIVGGGINTNVEIFVNGDLNGGIEIDNGVTAKVYVSGSINTNASQLKNDSGVAKALLIYGVPPAGASAPTIRLNLDADLTAAIYAPGHQMYLSGNHDVFGAVVAARFETSGAVRVHYDEALGYATGPLLRYEIASWKEIIN